MPVEGLSEILLVHGYADANIELHVKGCLNVMDSQSCREVSVRS
jgi:hypothetical protein